MVSPLRIPPDEAMLDRLFPEEDFGFRMKFQRGAISDFYDDSLYHSELANERHEWISRDSQKYVALEQRGIPVLNEAAQTVFKRKIGGHEHRLEALQLCELLAVQVEPDFLLLTPSVSSGNFELCGGSVCFPSSWGLEEKMGKPLDVIHAPVPGLHATIGEQINLFLRNMRPGVSWNRMNWGLSRSPELNQHPSRSLPRLDDSTPSAEIYLRVEWQSLVALPSSGILFGIRVFVCPLIEVIKVDRWRRGLARGLATMPREVAIYKNLWIARNRILSILE
jgi:hypothetical protein